MTPDPNPAQPVPTREELAVQMVHHLNAEGWTLDQITAFLVAQDQDGLLRPNCPAWKRQTGLFLMSHGRAYTRASAESNAAFVAEHAGRVSR